MTAPELKPCPFCGLPDASDVYVRDGRMIICTSCGASGGAAYHGPSGYGSTSEKAAIKWNRRADLCDPMQDPRVVALVESLRDAMSGLEYVRYHYGELHGVGFSRVRDAGDAAYAPSQRSRPMTIDSTPTTD